MKMVQLSLCTNIYTDLVNHDAPAQRPGNRTHWAAGIISSVRLLKMATAVQETLKGWERNDIKQEESGVD